MKKSIFFFLGCIAFLGAQGQTKQAVNATQQRDPAYLQQQSQSALHLGPAQAVQTVSGYIQEGFENTTFPPAGWLSWNVSGPTYTWARSTAQAHSGVASAYMRYDTGGGQDWLVLPHYLVTATTDSVVFWMRLPYAGYAPDSLCIKVSTTDSLTTSFNSTLLKLQEGVNYPSNTTTWYRYAVSLSAYNGQQIYVAFKHVDTDGDGVYVDDVSIGTPPAAEVGPVSINSPVSGGAGTQTPQVAVKNFGSAMQSFNVTVQINPGGYTSTMPVTSLSSLATTNVSFAPWSPAAGTYTVKAFTQLAGDQNMLNDTITKTVTIYSNFPQYGWSSHTALPAGRWATGPVFANPCLSSTDTAFLYLVTGGDASFANTALNTRYNMVTGTYTNKAVIPQSRTQVSPVQIGGKIYVIGGYTGSFTPVTTNSIYDIATDTWTTGAAMPTAVGDYAVGTYADSLIYYVSGYNGSADVNLVQIYNTRSNTWMSGTAKTGTAVAGARMGISGNKIVFVGGYSQSLATEISDALLGTISTSNPGTIAWSTLPAYPGGTSGRLAGGVSLENNGYVYFAGGDPTGQGTQVLNAVYAYNTTLGQWEVGPNMITGQSNLATLAGAVYNDSLYLVTMGGYTGTSVSSSNEWLNIGPATLPYVQNDTTICAGDTIMLHAYNGTTYSWSPAGSLDNAMIASPTSFANVPTTYTVTIGKLSGGCPAMDTLTLTVNPLPNADAGTNTAICMNSSVMLMGSGGTTYSWLPGTGLDNSSIDMPNASPSMTTTYTMTVTDANGCSAQDSVTVTVDSLPVISVSGTSVLCNGDANGTAGTTVNGSSTYSYAWSTGDNTANVTGLSAGTYTVTVTDNATMCQSVDSILINQPSAIVATIPNDTTFNCNGTLSPVVNGGTPPYSYLWLPGGQSTPTITNLCPGTYTLNVTDANGCTLNATGDIVVITGIMENGMDAMRISPNPASENVLLSGNVNGAATITILNVLGERMLAIDHAVNGVFHENVDLSSLPAGVYYVQLAQGNSILSTQQLIRR